MTLKNGAHIHICHEKRERLARELLSCVFAEEAAECVIYIMPHNFSECFLYISFTCVFETTQDTIDVPKMRLYRYRKHSLSPEMINPH